MYASCLRLLVVCNLINHFKSSDCVCACNAYNVDDLQVLSVQASPEELELRLQKAIDFGTEDRINLLLNNANASVSLDMLSTALDRRLSSTLVRRLTTEPFTASLDSAKASDLTLFLAKACELGLDEDIILIFIDRLIALKFNFKALPLSSEVHRALFFIIHFSQSAAAMRLVKSGLRTGTPESMVMTVAGAMSSRESARNSNNSGGDRGSGSGGSGSTSHHEEEKGFLTPIECSKLKDMIFHEVEKMAAFS